MDCCTGDTFQIQCLAPLTLPLGHENSELAFPKPNCAACHPLSEWDFGGDNMAGEGPTGNDPRATAGALYEILPERKG